MKQCPENSQLLALMAEVQISQGQYPLAELYARKALEYDPNHWQAHSVLGASLVSKQQYKEGIHHLNQAVAIAPENTALQLNLCQAYVLDQQHEKARPLCEQVARTGNEQMAELAKKMLTNINSLDSSTR
jgi:Flp pilus assembly protein TadD